MRIARTAAGLSAAALGLAGVAMLRANRWRRDVEERLRAGGTVVTTRLGPVEYAESGSGPPVLVVHGAPGGYDQALILGGLLGGGFRLIAPSRPGYLRTPLDGNGRPDEQADVLLALLDALGIRRVGVFGASGGGPAALQFGLRHPERAGRLVLLEAVTRRFDPDLGNLTGGPLTTDLAQWLLLGLARRFPRLVLPAALRGDPAARELVRSFVGSTFPLGPRQDGLVNDERQFRALPAYPLRELAVPTLLVHGTADDNVPFAQSEAAARAIPGARLVAVAGGDHLTTLVDPVALDAIRTFLRAGATDGGD